MRLLLARHGQTIWNAERRFQGSTDVPLSPLGLEQARALRRAFRGYRLAAAYVSPFRRAIETAEVALEGSGRVDGVTIAPGALTYLGTRRDEVLIESDEPSRLMLLGGVPFDDQLFMWWNFVGRSRAEIDAAAASWNADDGRFGTVRSQLARIPAPHAPWSSAS